MNCQHCQSPFKPSRQWQKFCSRGCRNAANNARRGAPLDLDAGVETIQEFLLRYADEQFTKGASDADALTLLKAILRAVGIPTKTTSQ